MQTLQVILITTSMPLKRHKSQKSFLHGSNMGFYHGKLGKNKLFQITHSKSHFMVYYIECLYMLLYKITTKGIMKIPIFACFCLKNVLNFCQLGPRGMALSGNWLSPNNISCGQIFPPQILQIPLWHSVITFSAHNYGHILSHLCLGKDYWADFTTFFAHEPVLWPNDKISPESE